jgi:hypothetical protein
MTTLLIVALSCSWQAAKMLELNFFTFQVANYAFSAIYRCFQYVTVKLGSVS